MEKILEVENLEQKFDLSTGVLGKFKFKKGRLVKEERMVNAVNKVSFSIDKGKVFSLVGESGCGKSTTARTVIKLVEPKGGTIKFAGEDITNFTPGQMLKYRKRMQMIFQDPYASLNPRQKIIDIITEPMLFHKVANTKKEAEEKALELLHKVGIRPEQATRYPHQFSGGQRQRIGIARALAVEPEFIIADEPVSALDVSIQAQILNLLMDLKDEFKFSYLFISHDPLHPYTKVLLSAVPKLSGTNLKRSRLVKGEIPSAINLPSGCYFHERCPYARPICKEEMPTEKEVKDNHFVLCHLY